MGKRVRRKQIWLFSLTIVGAFLLLTFQNFSSVPRKIDLSNFKPEFQSAYAKSLAAGNGTGDIRDIAPRVYGVDDRKPAMVAPESGSDLSSVSQDWIMRQTKLWTNGADEKFINDVNKRMHKMMKADNSEGEAQGDQDSNAQQSGSSASSEEAPASIFNLNPAAIRLTALNRVEVALANRSNFSCSVQGDGLQLDLARQITNRVDLNLRHVPSNNASTVRLHYNW